ncbi:MAG: hypothetical protein WBW79_09860 [Desulfocapsaceae bacterium]
MVEEKAYELFITERESLVLEALVKSDVPFSQRAQALLAVDAGSTLEQASLVSGLRVTQVKYWLARFDSGRLGIFPESVLEAIEAGLQSENLPTTGKASAGQAAGKSKKSKKKDSKKKRGKAGVSKDQSAKKNMGKKGKKAKKKDKGAKAAKATKKGTKKQKKKAAGKKSAKKDKK